MSQFDELLTLIEDYLPQDDAGNFLAFTRSPTRQGGYCQGLSEAEIALVEGRDAQ
ncbi:hypothetical protein HRbin07_00390 [bacterium HR07]|uniref:Uncharacterized protein n=1 Tax=Acetithermum autotrophicum TaxID=1446466 RepID=H5SRJ8_ACEAU|nr:hypothetical protein HGMM_OP2C263 [Candidatus Acetothermum autotrophicum]GBC76193.1 hypothetical protein HRbin07_00390 [bacterium HR07]